MTGAVRSLAHGLGGSSDLPVPYAYSVIGAAWALTFTFALVAFAWRRPRFDPLKPGHPLPAALTALVDSRLTRGIAAAAALVFAVWVVLAGLWGPQTQANALLGVFYVLLWVGLVAVSLLFGPVWRVISPVRTVYLLLQRITPERLSRPRLSYPEGWGYRPAAVGLFAFVWLELASPNPASLPWVQTVAADLCRGAAGRGVAVRATLVRPGRPVRRVQHGGFAALAVSTQPGDRENRHRQPVRSSAVAADSAGRGRDAGGAARLDRVRQLLVVGDLAQLRRPAGTRGARCAGGGFVVGTAHRRVAGLRCGGGDDLFAGRPRDGRGRPRAAPRITRPDGALADPDRGGLHLRPLPVLSRGARPAGRVRPRRSVRPRMEPARAGAPARRLCAVRCTRRCWP